MPVDGSPPSLRALRHVARSRRDAPVEVLVLNVQAGIPVSRFVTRAMIREYHERHAEEALRPARELIQRLKLAAECYMRVGDIPATIVDFARETGCGEIVMGARGLGRVAGLFVGSVATRVVHLAKVPVTLVK